MYENTTELGIIKIKNCDILVIYFETFFIPFDIFILRTYHICRWFSTVIIYIKVFNFKYCIH